VRLLRSVSSFKNTMVTICTASFYFPNLYILHEGHRVCYLLLIILTKTAIPLCIWNYEWSRNYIFKHFLDVINFSNPCQMSLTLHREGSCVIPGQPMWALQRAMWHWYTFSTNEAVFHCQYHATNTPYSSSSSRAAFSRRTNGISLGTLQKWCYYANLGTLKKKILYFFLHASTVTK